MVAPQDAVPADGVSAIPQPRLEALLEAARARILGGMKRVPEAALSRQERALINQVLEQHFLVHRDIRDIEFPHARVVTSPGNPLPEHQRCTSFMVSIEDRARQPIAQPRERDRVAELYRSILPPEAWRRDAPAT